MASDENRTTGCPMPDDVCADCGYRCGEIAQFIARQEPLGEPFATILHDNLWELYRRD